MLEFFLKILTDEVWNLPQVIMVAGTGCDYK